MQQNVCMSFSYAYVEQPVITPPVVVRSVKTPRTMAWYAASNYRTWYTRQIALIVAQRQLVNIATTNHWMYDLIYVSWQQITSYIYNVRKQNIQRISLMLSAWSN